MEYYSVKIQKRKSSVWSYFTEEEEGASKVKCNVCKSNFTYTRGSTSNLWKHLNHKHGVGKTEKSTEERVTQVGADYTHQVRLVSEEMDGYVLMNSRLKHKMYRKKSSVWSHFTTEEDGSKAKCSVCKANINCHRQGTTSNLWKHLKTHGIKSVSASIAQNVKIPFDKTDDTKDGSGVVGKKVKHKSVILTPCPSNKANAKKVDKNLVKMICSDLQPVSIVEDSGFQEFVRCLNPTYKLPTQQHITEVLLPELYNGLRALVQSEVKSASAVSLTTECWNSGDNDPMLAITAHFLTENFVLKSAMLDIIHLGDYTSSSLASAFIEVIREWNLEGKVKAVVTDEQNAMKEAVEGLNLKHLTCFAHQVNQIVQDGLASTFLTITEGGNFVSVATPSMSYFDVIATKVRDIVSYFQRTPPAMEVLKKLHIGDSGEEKEITLVGDNCTRWTSALQMVERFLEIKTIINDALVELGSELPMPDESEIQATTEILELLKPFVSVAVELSCEKKLPISKVMFLGTSLYHFVTAFIQNPKYRQESIGIARNMEQAMVNRGFHNLSSDQQLALSTLMDPRFKKQGFFDEETVEQTEALLVNSVVEFMTDTASENGQDCLAADSDHPLYSILKKKVQQSQSEPFAKPPTNQATREVSRFLEDPHLDVKLDPIQWWRENLGTYKKLIMVARELFCIVATSQPSDRLFTNCGDNFATRRSSLPIDSVGMLLFVGKNWDEFQT